MPLEVIGAGWGRTGTLSTKSALERLGYPCHHMLEVFAHPDQAPVFTAAARGESVDWETVYAPYRATVDWPGCAFWRQLVAAYPDAKVLLTVRDPAAWYESYRATIYPAVANGLPDHEAWSEMVREVIAARDLHGNPHDRDHLIAAFEQHVATVRAEAPADRLLVYDVTQGWEPLCAFLDVPVPDEAFPRLNDRATWAARGDDSSGASD